MADQPPTRQAFPDRCVVCHTDYPPRTGQSVQSDWLLSGPHYQVCRRCVDAGRWAAKGGREPHEARAAFVAQVREMLAPWSKAQTEPLLFRKMESMTCDRASRVYAELHGWSATLEAIAEALREEEK